MNSNINNTNENKINYAALYAKSDHNYRNFFTGYQDDATIKETQKEVLALQKLWKEKYDKYLNLLDKRYNVAYTPIGKTIVLVYHSRDRNNHFYFDFSTGMATIPEENALFVTLETKAGTIDIPTGYCFELGAVVSKKYSYRINSNNTAVVLNLRSETLVSIFEPDGMRMEVGDSTITSFKTSYGDSCNLDILNATEFIQNFYGIDSEFDFSLKKLRDAGIKNKSIEVIIKTCKDPDLRRALMDMSSEKAVPLHELVGVSKVDWKYAEELGVLDKIVALKRAMKGNGSTFTSEAFKRYLNKTDKEWIDFLEKIKHWENDLRFYGITTSGGLSTQLIEGYLGGNWRSCYHKFPEHYSFGKFCSYVVEESINQGYTSIQGFLTMLGDYLKMCEDLHVTPTLYSGYLQQTHDITSRNHKIKINAEQTEAFSKCYEAYEPYKDAEYTVIAPETPDDLKREGDTLNHCVASYIKRVIDKECLILFLRTTMAPLQSLVTLELRGKRIVQAKGLHNRHITPKERNALIKFATKRGYTVGV